MTKTYSIATICASLAKQSKNQRLIDQIAARSSDNLKFNKIDLLPLLPHFTPDLLDNPPEVVLQWRRVLSSADALLIAVPEYAHSFPGVLKNAIDWVIYSAELEEKIVGITANVVHSTRGEKGLLALASSLDAVKEKMYWQKTIVEEDETAIGELLECLNRTLGQAT